MTTRILPSHFSSRLFLLLLLKKYPKISVWSPFFSRFPKPNDSTPWYISRVNGNRNKRLSPSKRKRYFDGSSLIQPIRGNRTNHPDILSAFGRNRSSRQENICPFTSGFLSK